MAYRRFLINKDYNVAVTKDQFEMLLQGDENRLSQAEQRAEMRFMEYLDQHYEIEKMFYIGKAIRPYQDGITYPANSYFKTDDGIMKVVKPINGRKAPTAVIYWEQILEVFNIQDIDQKPQYSQLETYAIGDVVKFRDEFYICKVPNGYDFKNIQVPGTISWKEVKTTPWEANLEWQLYQVCLYNNVYYMLMNELKDDATTVSPDTNDAWAQIGEYSSDYNYSIGKHDYVVCENKVFDPIVNVNADKIETGVNVSPDDPRNLNVIEHMVSLSVYYLHEMVSPTNISAVRQLAYENSIQWLSNAARFKINPKIPRKQDSDTKDVALDFAVDTYQRAFDPYDDMWII